ncbi:MAG: adenylate/guanylate cyclase domain-containing protein [Betaproteobacteria bacterium]|nr:adenylate/guanylate cyclase domain-containing protein [Betaproteobacteria bacterium]
MGSLPAGTGKQLHFTIVVAIALVLAFLTDRAGWLLPLENIYYDTWHQFAGKRREAAHTAVIAVDDETLLALKDEPLAFWAPHFARAMQAASSAGAKTIGLDFIYTVSAEAWLRKLKLPDSEASRNYDSPLRAQLAAGNKILITHLVENAKGELELLLPPQEHLLLLPHGLNDLGVANLYPDADKLVRHFYPVLMPEAQVPGISFALQLALRAAGGDSGGDAWQLGGKTWHRLRTLERIGYVGPPGTVPTVSMKRLLPPDANADPQVRALEGRTVIIAANNSGSSDRHFTPYSRGILGWRSDQMTGGEIHANIVETLLSGHFPRSFPLALQWLYVLAWLVGGAFLYLRVHPAAGAGAAVALSLAALAPAYGAFLADWMLPTGAVQTALALGFLATLGLRLTGEERKRARLKQMFARYVSDEVVAALLAEGASPDLGGVEVEVTVLFSDIRNFTTLSEKLGAHEVVRMLNAFFSRAGEPILNQGGMVNKYIGDAVMAVFGSPVYYPDHARRALAAAVDLVKVAQEFRQWMKQTFPERGLPEFTIGIGLHTGRCVVGNIGSVKRTEFTAIGDTVNTASRLEGITKELGCVLVASAATVSAAGAGVRTGRRETVTAKGRSEPIEVFEVLGLEQARQS